ncbi:hypothetical protein AU255_03745 [Methyloprofundus sedimenti]|uniref:PEP-CTERM protein-sorting domain-containing protein n=1 Tax=Methyloprofundus sedimenti TaxID=1420851 RepID=A0A1V8M655_9GAMM|nr:VPLPA-CTERM sorting domain-containing protein [Methyloprofundus sedimenti]OQK17022.1 hypothetical protein AU255_03745 [Methyloprofundus sedimenti]
MLKKFSMKAIFLLASLLLMTGTAQASTMAGAINIIGAMNVWTASSTSVSAAPNQYGDMGVVQSSNGDFANLSSARLNVFSIFSDVLTTAGPVTPPTIINIGGFNNGSSSISDLLFTVTNIKDLTFSATSLRMILVATATATGFDDTAIEFLFEASNNGISGSYSLTTPVSSVPLPAAVWLFSSALAGLVGVSRRKSTSVAA